MKKRFSLLKVLMTGLLVCIVASVSIAATEVEPIKEKDIPSDSICVPDPLSDCYDQELGQLVPCCKPMLHIKQQDGTYVDIAEFASSPRYSSIGEDMAKRSVPQKGKKCTKKEKK